MPTGWRWSRHFDDDAGCSFRIGLLGGRHPGRPLGQDQDHRGHDGRVGHVLRALVRLLLAWPVWLVLTIDNEWWFEGDAAVVAAMA